MMVKDNNKKGQMPVDIPSPLITDLATLESRLGRIDYRLIVSRLMRCHDFTLPVSMSIVTEYLRFLILKASVQDYDGTELSPSPYVELAWHCHILDTNRYGAECEAFCGKVIGHNPDEDFAERPERFNRTCQLYLSNFHQKPKEEIWPAADNVQNLDSDTQKTNTKRKREAKKAFRIFVKTVDGKRFEFKVRKSDSVNLLKDMLSCEAWMETDMTLMFAERQLEDDKLLSYYGIGPESELVAIDSVRSSNSSDGW
ncbi:uncharacterized protein SPPG_09178 [Spizellomyces punctatus DAOM BR117]|uniref:Ubiquitin-like domain-containing protein n=1 Tax=Spizellomyces punctatus (strain DAOM BR117) TaxID=645134 RepID=A0A0L0HJ22_SPIPD|nr:uncharacterized protein SPPG_09178 [Spizellomyces punctatus DAOM BR117]KND01087.1 hypothetical protein SPPG_09178 [Spizellomyces punctatus DAOM BR117]|eukprot:XP_016609126.1 hypothetical protein SPPG_09178 [Spizellomyces punctatus DAOM BR117]